MSSPDDLAHRPLRSFGRIKSRALKPRQAALFDTLLPAIAVPDPKAGQTSRPVRINMTK